MCTSIAKNETLIELTNLANFHPKMVLKVRFLALKCGSGFISRKGDKEKHGTPEMVSEVVGWEGRVRRQNGKTDDKAPHAGEIEP